MKPLVQEVRKNLMNAISTLIRRSAIPVLLALSVPVCMAAEAPKADSIPAYKPKRINKAIELLEQGQPIYYTGSKGGYNEGKAMAKTWADVILYGLEHDPVDLAKLREFMQGLVDGGPTPSGHRTPAVIVNLPILGTDLETMKGGTWMIQQALAAGVHGVHLNRARSPEAVRRFVAACRYPIHKQAVGKGLEEGLRGMGSQGYPSQIWGIGSKEYFERADVWPLNPKGELLLGIKIEDRHALKNAGKSIMVPGIGFAESGPRDMGLSYGYTEGRADPPLPKEVVAASARVLALCNRAKIAFLDNALYDTVESRIDEGIRVVAVPNENTLMTVERGRRYTKRQMPW